MRMNISPYEWPKLKPGSGSCVGKFIELGILSVWPIANHPLAFIAHYVSRRAAGHVTIVATVIGAVTCSVAAQYAVKILVDVLTGGGAANAGSAHWWGLLLLASLIALE